MQDLTKIDKPFGLLDEETQMALKEYDGAVEVYGSKGWEPSGTTWYYHQTYRAKAKPREWWLNVYAGEASSTYTSKKNADLMATPSRLACVHVREVLEGEP